MWLMFGSKNLIKTNRDARKTKAQHYRQHKHMPGLTRNANTGIVLAISNIYTNACAYVVFTIFTQQLYHRLARTTTMDRCAMVLCCCTTQIHKYPRYADDDDDDGPSNPEDPVEMGFVFDVCTCVRTRFVFVSLCVCVVCLYLRPHAN